MDESERDDVRIVGVDIPFDEMVGLAFKVFGAWLVVNVAVVLPLTLLIILVVNANT